MDAPIRDCPKCSGSMMVRLGEYECNKCGFFEPLSGIPGATEKLQLGLDDSSAELASAGSRSLRVFGHNSADNWLATEKIVFLTILFLALTLGNILLRAEYKQEYSYELEIQPVLIGGSVIILLVSVLLFIDWRGMKMFGLVLVGLLLLMYGFSLNSAWNEKSQLILLKLFSDVLLIGWLASILARDVKRSLQGR